MNPIKHYPLRKIAENELIKLFGDLDDATRSDLTTSLVRQWLTYDGHAGLVTPTHHFWFRAVPNEDGGLDIGVSKTKHDWSQVLARKWHVEKEKIPGLLHQLSLGQAVLGRISKRKRILMRMKPKEQRVLCQGADPEP